MKGNSSCPLAIDAVTKNRALSSCRLVLKAELKGRCRVTSDRIIAVGLLTQRDVEMLGPAFDRLWPVEEAPCFSELLRAIDDAEGASTAKPDGAEATT
jgi:hypothetical protein